MPVRPNRDWQLLIQIRLRVILTRLSLIASTLYLTYIHHLKVEALSRLYLLHTDCVKSTLEHTAGSRKVARPR